MMKFKVKSYSRSNYTIPVIIIITFALFLGTLLGIMQYNSVSNQKRENDLLAERYSKKIELNLKGNIDFLNLLKIELREGNLPESIFQDIVKSYLKNHPELINITKVDSNFTIESVSPLHGNSHIIGLNIELPMPKRASRLAKEQKQTIYTEPFEAIQGKSSFEAWNPIFDNNKFMGLFVAVYSSNAVINTWIEKEKHSNTIFSLLDNKGVVIAETYNRTFNTNVTYTQRSLSSLNNGMTLQVKSEISYPFTPLIIVIVLLLCLLILGIAYVLLQLENTQESLQKKELLLLNKNTELTIAKEKSEESEAKFKAYTEQSPIAVYITDVDGDCIYANETWLEITGMHLEDALGKGWTNALHPDDLERIKNGWYDSIKSNGKWSYEYRFLNKEGVITWVEGSAKEILNNQNKLIGYLGSNVNISSRKKTEQDLQIAKQKAEESDRLKSAFLANMSHEIRTPMNGILGFTNLLKEPHLSGQEQQKYIQIIEKGGLRLINIINDIISISKIESGQMEINIQESNINEQIEYLYTFFKPEVEAKGLTFSFKNGLSSSDAKLITDIEKVYAILTNLIKNAIKYSEKGSIEFGYKLKRNREPAELEFYLKDTGIGIPKDRQKVIFERFIQANNSDKTEHQGAGLGLSISKAYVEKLGGRIWLESEEGHGTTFYFTLPYQIQSEEKPIIKNHVSLKGVEKNIQNLKILIVEDDEASEFLMSIIVQEFCSETLIAKTGREAIEICRNNSDIDLILMDILLPDIDGYKASRQIRRFNQEVIIIAQTAYSFSGDDKKAIKAGCNEYITKPIIKDQLLELIQKYYKK